MESHSLLSHSMSKRYIFVQLANTKTFKSTNSDHVIHISLLLSIFLLDRNSLNSMYFVQKIYCTMMLVGNQNQMYTRKTPKHFFLISACCVLLLQ